MMNNNDVFIEKLRELCETFDAQIVAGSADFAGSTIVLFGDGRPWGDGVEIGPSFPQRPMRCQTLPNDSDRSRTSDATTDQQHT